MFASWLVPAYWETRCCFCNQGYIFFSPFLACPWWRPTLFLDPKQQYELSVSTPQHTALHGRGKTGTNPPRRGERAHCLCERSVPRAQKTLPLHPKLFCNHLVPLAITVTVTFCSLSLKEKIGKSVFFAYFGSLCKLCPVQLWPHFGSAQWGSESHAVTNEAGTVAPPSSLPSWSLYQVLH